MCVLGSLVASKKPPLPPARAARLLDPASAASAAARLEDITASGQVPIAGGGLRDPFDLVGDVIDTQFRVDEVAGEGHLAVVYRGHHLGVDAPIAIKCLDLPATVDRALLAPVVRSFREGCRIHYRLARGSLDIAQTLASGTTLAPCGGAEVPYMVREWLEGHSLGTEIAWRKLRDKRGVPIAHAMALLEGAARGLAYAHAQGVAHLALDPTNVFVVIAGKDRHTKILDFGLAAALGRAPVEVGGDRGAGLQLVAPRYAAPEQMDRSVGAPGPQTDVYALAILLLEVMSGRPAMPAGERTVEAVLDATKRPTPRAHGVVVPRAIEVELDRAVAFAPKDRHADAGAFWAALERAASPVRRPASAPAVVAPAPAPPPPAVVEPAPPPPASDVETGDRPTLHGLPPLVVLSDADVKAAAERISQRGIVAEEEEALDAVFGVDSTAPAEPTTEAPSAPPAAAAPPPEAVPAPPPPVVAAVPLAALPAQPVAPATAPVAVAVPIAPRRPAAASAAPTPVGFVAPVVPPPRPRPVDAAPSVAAQIATVTTGTLAQLVVLVVTVMLVASAVAPRKGRPSAAPLVLGPPPRFAVALPKPPPRPPAAAPAPKLPPFDRFAANAALSKIGGTLATCKKDKGLWGKGSALVTFAPDGTVAKVKIGWPFDGTAQGTCIVDALSTARVRPFAGSDTNVYVPIFVPR